MALRQHQELKQTQKLSPLQMQVIKLIELNSVELEERVKHELEENPALDESNILAKDEDVNTPDDRENISQEELMMGDYFSEDDVPQYQLNRWENKSQSDFIEATFASDTSLNNFLMDQISLRELDDDDFKVAEYIIGNLDENGYLKRSLQSISDDLLFQQNIDVGIIKLDSILEIIKDLDPAGVGASDLQECLKLQLERNPESDKNKLAINIVTNYFYEFSRKHYDKLELLLEVSREELREAISEITSLNPKPGNTFGDTVETHMSNITPDFIVEVYNGEISMSLNNRDFPQLVVSKDFSEMMQAYSENKDGMSADKKQALMFMKQKMDSAKWFIQSVKQRQDTLYKTMEAIISMQYDFFITEDETMLKPMIMKNIAEKTGLDISTVSRVSNSKYVQTNGGIYPLKFFFSEAMQNETGEDVSTRKIKYVLKQIVESEDSQKPLTDEKLTALLNEKGYVIARRTVAKYREHLNIPVARLRKKV